MKAFVSALCAIAITSCAVSPSLPRAEETQQMRVAMAGAGMRMPPSDKSPSYYFHVGVVFKEGATLPAYATARFENPDNPSKPFVVTQRVASRGKVVLIESPRFTNRPTNRISTVIVELYRDASKRQKIDELRQAFIPNLPSDQQMRSAGLGHLVP